MINQIKRILVENFDSTIDNVTPATRLIRDLELDSLEFVQLVVAVEEEFDVSIGDNELSRIWTIGDILRVLVEEKR